MRSERSDYEAIYDLTVLSRVRIVVAHTNGVPMSSLSKTGDIARTNDFPPTHWEVVAAAGSDSSADCQAALELLCRSYWHPLYAYVRRRGYGAHDAEDLTQDFFAQFLRKEHLKRANPELGEFRSFLLTCLKNFLSNEWDRAHTEKRGG